MRISELGAVVGTDEESWARGDRASTGLAALLAMAIQVRRKVPVPQRVGKLTEMRVIVPPITLVFRIEGPLSIRMRRQVNLAVFRAIRPIFPTLEEAFIRHRDGHWANIHHDLNRPIGTSQALGVDSARQKLGLTIRMRRLALGLTQAELARRVSLNATYLSRIEHGHHLPRKIVLSRIEEVLRVLPGSDGKGSLAR